MRPVNTVSIPVLKAPRVLALCGSPHPDGCTARLLDRALDLLPARCDITRVQAYPLAAAPCIDCGACKKEKRCALRDMDGFYETFEQADALMIASPIYNGGFPAPLKAVLDRMQVYYNARFCRGERPPVARPKRAALLLTCGSPDTGDAAALDAVLRRMYTVLNTISCGYCCVDGTDRGFSLDGMDDTLRTLMDGLLVQNEER